MFVVSRSRLPSVVRHGCPVPSEVLFKRRAEVVGVSTGSDEASDRFSATRCGGGVRSDQRIPVHCALRVLRRVDERPGCVAFQSVASGFVSVAFESQCQAYAFPEYRVPVASASQPTAFMSAHDERPSSTIPLVLKSLARRAAAAKVSRRWRRLEDVSSRVASGCVPGSVIQRSRVAASKASAVALRTEWVQSVASVASDRARVPVPRCVVLRPASRASADGAAVLAFPQAFPHSPIV
jgi:hypothetical protein